MVVIKVCCLNVEELCGKDSNQSFFSYPQKYDVIISCQFLEFGDPYKCLNSPETCCLRQIVNYYHFNGVTLVFKNKKNEKKKLPMEYVEVVETLSLSQVPLRLKVNVCQVFL